MDALLQPVVIERVFQFLQVFDVDRCQYVCRAWHECASRILRKCPTIDSCESSAIVEFWQPGQYQEIRVC